MKQLLPAILFSIVIFSCNTPAKTDDAKTDSTAAKQALVYPFVPKYGINWQPGDEKNAVIVLNSYKKYLDGDVKGSFESFTDSFEFIADKFHFKGKKDSLMAMMIPLSAGLASSHADVDTWITTYYPDQKATWVTIWSKETFTDKKGKTDSLYLVDDVLVKDGKIAQIDEKQRQYPAPMKMK